MPDVVPQPRAGVSTTDEATAAVLQAVVDSAGLGIALISPDGALLQVNPALSRMLGYSVHDLLGMTVADLVHPDDSPLSGDLFTSLQDGLRDTYRVEKRYVPRDGGVRWGAATVSAVRRPDGRLSFAVGLVEDISERRRLEAELRQQALHDHLTGLPNRRLFEDRVEHALALSRRHQQVLAMVFVDLDGFKAINDERGHAVGDKILCAVAERLCRAARDSDTVARLGGDEFVVLCEGGDGERHAEAVVQRLRQALSQPVLLPHGSSAMVAASMGIATSLSAEQQGADLLRAADEAMYEQKRRRFVPQGR